MWKLFSSSKGDVDRNSVGETESSAESGRSTPAAQTGAFSAPRAVVPPSSTRGSIGRASSGANADLPGSAGTAQISLKENPGPFRRRGSIGGRAGTNSTGEDGKHQPSWAQGGGSVFQAIMTGRAYTSTAAVDAEMERKVSVAARNLGDGVQKIVMAAKMGGTQRGLVGSVGSGGQSSDPDEWKIRLLQLLGGLDSNTESARKEHGTSDVDVLLTNSFCDKFVLRCVENELPPNLIHCLRLLRVLELQHANAAARESKEKTEAVSEVATNKVAKLLCMLCTDHSVGEQLRPHLFGLLALSGASYPPSGVHVARAASSVISAFADACLSSSLVWFLHDRKMIVHMTDDVKELCGMTAVSSPSSVQLCLYGQAAEAAGLWMVALKTVVHLVTTSCNYQCIELLRDFDAAGGYHVLCYAIINSGGEQVPKLLELVTTLVCCKTEGSDETLRATTTYELNGSPPVKSVEGADMNESHLATNPNAFEIVEDLMARSLPLLVQYAKRNGGARPLISIDENLYELASVSLDVMHSIVAENKPVTSTDSSERFDLASELLVTTLQLFSDHAKNYSIIESKYSVLAHYLLAFPTFADVSVKVLVLKTLEYVCTGLSGSNFIKPLSVASEIFYCLCKDLLFLIGDDNSADDKKNLVEVLTMDVVLLSGTLERLLQFEESVSQVLVDRGLLDEKLDHLLAAVVSNSKRRSGSNSRDESKSSILDEITWSLTPSTTRADEPYSAICRILRLVCKSSFPKTAFSGARQIKVVGGENTAQDFNGTHEQNLNLFLTIGITELGTISSNAALSVFESKMSSSHDETLQHDMNCVIEILNQFCETLGRISGILESSLEQSGSPILLRGKRSNAQEPPKRKTVSANELQAVMREATAFSTLKAVMEVNESAQDVFRTCLGFESIARVMFCLHNLASDLANKSNPHLDGINDSVSDNDPGCTSAQASQHSGDGTKVVMMLLESAFDVLSAATTPVARNQKNFTESSTSSKSMDMLTDDDTSSTSPAFANRVYIRQKGFFVGFSSAIAGTEILHSPRHARSVVNFALQLIEPNLNLPGTADDDEAYRRTTADLPKSLVMSGHSFIQNPDATRLVLGLAIRLPLTDSGMSLGKRALDEILKLSSIDMTGTTLSQLASSGLCQSLTNPNEFAPVLEDRSHHLYSRFVLLLRRIASFSMAYIDFVALLRCVAGPLLRAENDDGIYDQSGLRASSKTKRIRLPVISSAGSSMKVHQKPIDAGKLELWQNREEDFCSRLDTLSVVAERGDRVSRCSMGGDSLNTIALYMQKTPVEQRLYTLAEQGRIKFLEIETIDSSAKAFSSGTTSNNNAANSATAAAEKVWTPLTSTGFSYSLWLRLPAAIGHDVTGNIFVLDLSSPPGERVAVLGISHGIHEFFSIWYDLESRRFNVLSSSSSRNEPTCFPVSPLVDGVWHHVLLTFQPPKRAMLSRKSVLGLCVDGRPLEADIKIDSVALPPSARMYVGVPNPVFASSGLVRGALPVWELGPTLLFSTILGTRDATSMFAAGPDFQGLFWGDRPQRLSLAATATSMFAMLAENGEQGSVAGALRRRGVQEVEAAGHVIREREFGGCPMGKPESDLLTAVGLLCNVSPEYIVCGFRASSSTSSMRDGSSSSNKRHYSRRLVNVAKINTSNELVSTDAVVFGNGSVVSPHSFADNVQWIGGPNVLLPIVNATRSTATMALALRLIRESCHNHPPNLEMLQAGGGYRMLGLLLRQKRIMDANVLDQCFAFAVHGFVPGSTDQQSLTSNDKLKDENFAQTRILSDHWVFTDLDAMKYLLLNHQVWDLRGSGPDLPIRLLSFLNGLVAAHSSHAAFNSRRLHLLGIIRWTLHLMLEAAELYTAGASNMDVTSLGSLPVSSDDDQDQRPPVGACATASFINKGRWYVRPPSVTTTAIGGDPGNALLVSCKMLLRRVLTYMLTPGDLEAIAGAAIYTVSISGSGSRDGTGDHVFFHSMQRISGETENNEGDEKLLPGPVARVYLLRLLEELVVDGVNEIVTASNEKKGGQEIDLPVEGSVLPHAGGATGTNQSYLAMSMMIRKKNNRHGQPYPHGGTPYDASFNPKHQQAQAFLSAFAGILTPVWFACILEGCREEASASAVLRLMILMLQSSPTFAAGFEEAGGFAPLVLSIPKFSTCASIIMSMLSQLLHAPILHLPSFGNLDSTQLCEVFEAESDATELTTNQSVQGGLSTPTDPSCGIFALLAECLGRNIQLASFDNELGAKARRTNEAVLRLLGHRHTFSSAFQEFCRTPDFLEPLAQALCLVHDEKLQKMQRLQEAAASNVEPAALNSEPTDLCTSNSRDGIADVSDDVAFMAWPSSERSEASPVGPRSSHRRKLRCSSEVNPEVTATERFVGKAEEGEGSGIGMVQILHLVLSHAVLSGPLAAPLVSALFRSFPIHASPDQVEAFHLVLIEHCRSVVEDALQRGEPIALANCVGVSSVLLDRLMAGFFTSEPVLEAVKIVLAILNCLSTAGTYASRTLGTSDQNILVADTAHLARLTCLTALQRSRPTGPYDDGDDNLKIAILDAIGRNLKQLLLVPTSSTNAPGSKKSTPNTLTPPPLGTRLHQLWQSASLTRCCPPTVFCTFPDLAVLEEPDRSFVVALVAEIHVMLLDGRRDIREQAVFIVISLLQQRRGIMSELLITDIPRADNRMETVDLINRGGFGALIVAHEAATVAENITTVPRKRSTARRNSGSGGVSTSKQKYASFFEWLDRNQSQVAAVFHGIHVQASRLLPGFDIGTASPEEAIENEQKVMLLKLTSHDTSDRTILGGLERAELAQRFHDRTANSHALWKRQGFDDLSSGAMQWKFLLRQLKGSCSIWEGRFLFEEESPFSESALILYLGRRSKLTVDKDKTTPKDFSQFKENPASVAQETVTRWKLDLTEGYERQRRRLLPNYEFHSLYNVDEAIDDDVNKEACPKTNAAIVTADEGDLSPFIGDDNRSNPDLQRRKSAHFDLTGDAMEATAALLKVMQLGKTQIDDDDDFFEDALENEEVGEYSDFGENVRIASQDIDGTSLFSGTTIDSDSRNPPPSKDGATGDPVGISRDSEGGPIHADLTAGKNTDDEVGPRDNVLASSYDLITGLLQAGDWPEKSYNVKRCTGLEVRQALLLWCRNAIYVIDGFEQTDGEGLEGKITRLEKATSTYYINLRPQGFTSFDPATDSAGANLNRQMIFHERDDGNKNKDKEKASQASAEDIYQHRSQKIAFRDLYSVYRRRYQLQQNALEFYDVHRNGTLIAFSNNAEREEVLSKVLASPLPNSIFSSSLLGGSTSINYKKFMNILRVKITSQWIQGKITNFDFIMHLNSFAGRSYNDLTQYPVFPWILADYDSEEIDLKNPAVYRDLSKPMGGQGETRAVQFRERYEALEGNYLNEDEPPPFHYGTHYSCAAYVLYYLMRLEPFSRLALSLQGGRFDVADRLFHNIGGSWRSASTENLQDVRELIPEFFYLPEFLVNSNMFDFGTTQMGKTVHHVTLPAWAKGDPRRFISINRQALESEYVSRHLHKWADLIFGYKQRGREAVVALNTFVHVTYEGSVDLDSIKDAVQRESTISQIQNFGQTPSRLERKPFPGRSVMVALKDKSFDFNALSYLSHLTPPFCIVGAPHRAYLRVTMWDTCRVGMSGQSDSSVGDMCLVKGQLVGVGKTCALILPSKKYYRFGGPNNGVSVHVAMATARYREVNRVLTIHDGMHRAPITAAKPSLNGLWLVTGCVDSTLRVWKYDGSNMQLQASLCGHESGKITCIDVCTTFGTIVSGGADGNVLVWDLRTLTFLRQLRHTGKSRDQAAVGSTTATSAVSVSLNHRNGNIVALVESTLNLFDINGNLLATMGSDDECSSQVRPSCAISTDCPEWMENGIVAVTGHVNGDVRLWGIDNDNKLFIMRHLMPDKVHSCPITCLRAVGERQDTLLVGDKSGKMSMCKTLQLEALNQQELAVIMQELRTGVVGGDLKQDKGKGNTEGGGWMSLVSGVE